MHNGAAISVGTRHRAFMHPSALLIYRCSLKMLPPKTHSWCVNLP